MISQLGRIKSCQESNGFIVELSGNFEILANDGKQNQLVVESCNCSGDCPKNAEVIA